MTAIRTIACRAWPEYGLARTAGLALLGSFVVAAAAQINVPMWPVPMTLQTLAVLAVGAAYGARLGAITLGLYLLEGALGLPFFAKGQAGFFTAEGTLIASGGYIFGFILAAWLVGFLVEKGWIASLWRMCLATLAGAAALYVPGLIWLAVWAAKTQNMAAGEALSAAVAWGLTPFVIGDIIKAVIAALGVGAIWKSLAARG